MKSDISLHEDIASELETDPRIDASRIAFAVDGGVVTLSGSVPSYWQKVEAAEATRRVREVRAVANELTVELASEHFRDDVDIVSSISHALGWHSDLPATIQVTVSNGWVTLSGAVDWPFQKQEAESAAKAVIGVRGVVDNIQLNQS